MPTGGAVDLSLYRRGDIVVTDKVARFGDTTYPIANIGSVSITTRSFSGAGATIGVLGGLFGLGMIWADFNDTPGDAASFRGGVAVIVVSVVIAVALIRTERNILVLKTSSGDVQAFESQDKAEVKNIKTAIERAFVARR